MIIRSEQNKDYIQIAKLNYIAFSNWKPDRISVHEPEMTSLARQSIMFDSDLSIVAELNGEIIGHVLLVPSKFIVLGEIITGVLLGPIAVLPEYQKLGIGRKLIEKGHKTAKNKGYEFSLLCGHPSYYPKFGYIQKVFSIGGTEIKTHNKKVSNNLSKRPLRIEDVPVISRWQKNIRQNDTLSILFDDDIMEYHSYAPTIESLIITKDHIPICFLRRYFDNKYKLKILLFEEEYLNEILQFIKEDSSSNKALIIDHPFEIFRKLLSDKNYIVTDKRAAHAAFMICPLNDNSIINSYCHKVLDGKISPGVISYPPYCDVDV